MNQQLNCEHYGLCGGCNIETDLSQFPLVNEAQDYFSGKGIVNAPVHYFGAHGWRIRAKLAVRGTVKAPEIGLFEKNSHRVLAIPRCQVHHPSINAAVEIVRKWMISSEISPYEEVQKTGVLRYIQCTVERTTGKVQLALVCNGSLSQEAMQKLWESSPLWHSIWVNQNRRSDNVIFGDQWHLIFGPLWLWENLAGIDCCFHPAGFLQANLTAFEALLKKIGSWVSGQQKIIEYYAGTGVIGLTLAAKGCHVSCFEVNAACEAAFNETKALLKKSEITWSCSTTESALMELSKTTGDTDLVVVVDPPRKGLDAKTLAALGDANAGVKLIYVSCAWESCKRDLDYLVDSGWKLLEGEIYIFFPGSQHIETLSLLIKV